MKVVLLENIENLGQKGETREIKDGFARNYLLPKQLAVAASDPLAKELVSNREKQEQVDKEKEWHAAEAANSGDGKVVVVKVKVGAKKQLFAGVNMVDLKKEIKAQLNVEPLEIKAEGLKTLGDHAVSLEFGYGKVANITVRIESKE